MSDKYVKANGIINAGKLSLNDPDKFKTGLAFLGKSDRKGKAVPTKCTVLVELDYGYRTNKQLRFLFGHFIGSFVEVTGYAKHEALEIIKDECDLFHFEYPDYKTGEVKIGKRSLRDSYWTTKRLNKLLVWLYEFIISIDVEMASKMESPY